MIGRFATVILAFSWLPDCKGVGEPGSFEKFIARGADLGSEEICSAGNDGKRFWLEGYLQLPPSFSISSGKTNLAFYARIDGNGRGAGRSIRVNVTAPGDIDDLWSSATGKKTVGFRSEQAQIDPDALRIRARNGVATARDKIKLSVDIERKGPLNAQDKFPTTCWYHFAGAEKV
jgi:hypothetical protein